MAALLQKCDYPSLPRFILARFVERVVAGACRRAGYSGQTRTAELVSAVCIGATIVEWFSIFGPHESTNCMRMQSLKHTSGRIDTTRACTWSHSLRR